MITYVRGNIFESPASTLVNTVNIVGAMGKGIALEFKRLYPEMFTQYRTLCERKELTIGALFLYRTEHKSVLNFPTKEHWRRPSKPEYIEEGLKTFVRTYESAGIHSIAFPALGCGHGGLNFESQVKPLMESWLSRVACRVFIYPHRAAYQIPEHRDVKEMKRWLRTMPRDLTFVEVWDDLRDLLARHRAFRTFTTNTRFSATMHDEPPGLRILRGPKKWLLPYDDLLDFWHQLRSFGFISARSAPSNRSRDASYVAPILAELPYVEPVRIAGDYVGDADFERDAEYALQFIPESSERQADTQFELMPAC
jgi:O-acetyl-ADP-ribose deacetylase (regulator of RNase III)